MKPAMRILVTAMLIGGLLLVGCESPEETRKRKQGERQAEARLAEISDPVEYEKALRAHLGTNNRDRSKLWTFSLKGETVKFTLSASDNLTQGFIKLGALTDIRDVLRLLGMSSLPWMDVEASSAFPLEDKYGRSEETVILRGHFWRAELGKVVWDNFDVERLPHIAEEFYIHPACQD